QEHVLTGIISLQFEDMISQLLTHTRKRFGALEEFVLDMANVHNKEGIDDYEQRVIQATTALDSLIEQNRIVFDQLEKKAVNQESMTTGEVDLF
ncbi:MAG: hypothetical protein AB8D52_13215, partial [Gammaproteobacteria bacterium]